MTYIKKNTYPPLVEETEFELPLLPARDSIVFPQTMTPLFIGRPYSVLALEAALAENSQLVVVAQIDPEIEDPSPDDLYTIGTEINIERLLRLPDETTNILAQGKQRVQIIRFTQEMPYLRVLVRPLPEVSEHTPATQALMRAVLALFEKCVQLNRNIPDDAYVAAMNVNDAGWLADMIASVMDWEVEQRQQILDTVDSTTRLQRLSIILAQELDVLQLESRIQDQVQQEVDKGQREYFLREQMRAIQNELGEFDLQTAEVNELRQRFEVLALPDDVQAKAERELKRLAMMPPAAPEVDIVRTYLDWLAELPWYVRTEDTADLLDVAQVLDSYHHGIPKVKARILEYIAVQQRAGDKMRSPILCFVGPPGTGKTSLGRSIAEALGREFVRVSLGGVRDEAEIRGHRRTYIGAMPGRIIQNMRRVGAMNPVFMLDEIDKIGTDFRGDPSAALLELLDPEQNKAFSDHYLELPYDLSKVFFITTANLLHPIPEPLRDRMEVIEFSSYIEEEKLAIARQFIIPRQRDEHGLEDVPLSLPEKTLKAIIREYTNEAGVRDLERKIGQIFRKITRRLAEGKTIPKTIGPKSLPKYLGNPIANHHLAEKSPQVGVATGLAYTQNGGDLMAIEVALMPGKGKLTLTGQLGEVMRESAETAFSFTRAYAEAYSIDPTCLDKQDIHLHVPEGAIPKDGPSAGITIATAMVSALSGRAVRHDVAMTGEITLRGRVLPIGGFKDKLLAAHRAGIKTVLVPLENKRDVADLPKRVQRELRVIFAETMSTVLENALVETSLECN